jgi:ABC-2 type transport system permease protein
MAELSAPMPANGAASSRWTSEQTAGQFRAIAWLRWRMLINGFRRKGGAGELIGRIIVYPFLAAFLLGPTFGAGVAAWYFTSHHEMEHLSWLLWATFLFAQVISLNVGRSGTTFDPNELIRFPMKLRRFVVIRLFFGTLSPPNILAMLVSAAMAAGVTAAQPRLFVYAVLALGLFAATLVFFNRMIFAWIDRWLSTRRAREIFTALIFILSMGFQWVNISMNPAYNHHRGSHQSWAATHQKTVAMMHFAHRVHPMLFFLPPELTTKAIIAADHGHTVLYLGCLLGTGVFAAAFLLVFAMRMRTEFRGEALSDTANAVAKEPAAARSIALPVVEAGTQPVVRVSSEQATVLTVLRKELIYVRRNTGLFYSLIVPALMVLLFASRSSMRGSTEWLLPGAVAYALFSVLPSSYNLFGLEGSGIQFYFLAPVRLRDVFLAKNLINMCLAAIEILCVIVLLWYLRGRQSWETVVLCLLWAMGALLVGMTIGNVRSITAPMRVDFTRAATKQAAPVNAFLSMGVLLAFAALGWALLFAGEMLHMRWLLVPAFAVVAGVGLLVYLLGLRKVERIAMDHRESMYGVLSKQS